MTEREPHPVSRKKIENILNRESEPALGTFKLRAVFLIVMGIGFAVASAASLLMIAAVDSTMHSYVLDPKWGFETQAKAVELQQYVTENDINSHEREKIREWAIANKDTHLNIYTKDRKIFETSENYFTKTVEYAGEIQFSDTVAKVRIYFIVPYASFISAVLIAMLVGVIIYLAIVMSVVGRLIRDIDTLESDVKILEGGGLDHEIRVTRGDEVGSLQQSLDEMRLAFRDNFERDEKLTHANTELVKRMAHDLRTPLTSLMLYLDLLDRGEYDSDEKFHQFLRTASEKAERIKVMSDTLFEHSLIPGMRDNGEDETEPADTDNNDASDSAFQPELIGSVSNIVTENIRTVLEDELSMLCMTLEAQGFTLENHIEWPQAYIKASMDFVDRIMDNIYSNIVKYADKSGPVMISVSSSDEEVILSVSNHVGIRDKRGSMIGLENIRLMMDKMNGSVEIRDDGEVFELIMQMPVEYWDRIKDKDIGKTD